MVRTVMDFSKVDSGEYLINPNFSSNLEEGHREIKVIKSKIDSALNSVARKIGREAEKEVKLELHPIHGYCFKVIRLFSTSEVLNLTFRADILTVPEFSAFIVTVKQA